MGTSRALLDFPVPLKTFATRHAHACALLISAFMCVLVAILLGALLLSYAAHGARDRHQQAAAQSFAALDYGIGMLAALGAGTATGLLSGGSEIMDSGPGAACSKPAMERARLMLLGYNGRDVANYAKDIGILSADGRLLCSAMLGVSPRQIALGQGGSLENTRLNSPVFIHSPVTYTLAGQEFQTVALVQPWGVRGYTSTSTSNPGDEPGGLILFINRTAFEAGQGAGGASAISGVLALASPMAVSTIAVTSDSRILEWLLGRGNASDIAFNWRTMSFQATSWMDGAPIFYASTQKLVPAIKAHAGVMWVAVVGLVAILFLWATAHRAFARTFIAWGAMRNRIIGLFNPRNIVLLYQPIVCLHGGRIVGCEALVRLKDGGTLLTPDKFLDAVSSSGLESALDKMVLGIGAREALANLPVDYDFKVSFNFFPANIYADDIIEIISAQRIKHPESLIQFNIEVIEREYQDNTVANARKLQQSGVSVTVDDFGTCYSNLGNIKKLAPDHIKIDRSFVHGIEAEDNAASAAIVNAIVALAAAGGATVVAEGVETEVQRKILANLGVHMGQGYYFARPMPISELASLVHAQCKAEALRKDFTRVGPVRREPAANAARPDIPFAA